MTRQTVRLTLGLSPDKIVLLALIAAYCAGILPKKTHRPLLSTVVRYVEGPSVHASSVAPVAVPALAEMLRSISDACVAADAASGAQYAADIELRVLHALWTIQSLDSLHTFITRSEALLVRNLDEGRRLIATSSQDTIPSYLLTHSSFLGRFVRSCLEAFKALELDKVDLLWRSFVSFREASKPLWQQVSGTDGQLPTTDLFGSSVEGDDPTLIKSLLARLAPPTDTNPDNGITLVSQDDLSRLVNYQVHIFETYGTPTHPDLKNILMNMSQSEMGKIPSTHYIKYLECLHDADFEGAFNSLHRYFDYMMSNKHTVFYHYALLSLASLYAEFNCEGEAIRAIEESISVARDNRDMTCLNFLLSWVFNFLKDRPNLEHQFYVSNDQLLQFLKSKGGESSMALHSTAYQSDAVQQILEGGSLSSILESLTKAQYISLNGNSKSLSFINYCGISSPFWLRTGNFELAEIYTDIALGMSTSMSQKVDIMVRKATLDFISGNVESCFDILDEQKALVSGDVRLTRELIGHRLLLQARQSIRLSRFNLAEIYLSRLETQQHVNVDIKAERLYLTALLHLNIGNLTTAFNIVTEEIEEFAHISTNKYWFTLFSILKCKILTRSSSPSRAFSMSIQCLNTAAASGFTILVLHAVLQLCDILIRLGQFPDARDLITEALPKFEQAGDLELKSLAYQHVAQIMIKLYMQDSYNDEKEKVEAITKIVECLETSIDGFKRISCFEEIKKSLELQLEIGNFMSHNDIVTHAKASLETVNQKIEAEITAVH